MIRASVIFILSFSALAWPQTQTCQTRDDISADMQTALETVAHQVFDQAARGDSGAMRANSTSALQGSFGSVAAAVTDNNAALAGAHPQVRLMYVLNTGATPSADGRYICGAFGPNGPAPNSAEFLLPGLATGRYAIVIQDFSGARGPYALTTIFEDVQGWKLAGFYVRPEAANGHDGLWYLLRAREYKAKSQGYNAWFYYITSWDLLAPVTFMDTNLLSKIIQESAGLMPSDVPQHGGSVNFNAAGKTYKITEISVFRTDKSLDLSLKYSVTSTADFVATQADAKSVAAAYAAQHPEIKEAFNNIWAHAVDPNGGDVAGVVSLKPAAKP